MKKYIPIAVILIAFASCRKEGCTDKKAINFNITADVDDGSCIYCDEKVTVLGNAEGFIVDEQFQSSHYQDSIVYLEIEQTEELYSDQSCGINNCSMDLKFTNLLSDDIINLDIRLIVVAQSSGGTLSNFTQNFYGIMIKAEQDTLIEGAFLNNHIIGGCHSITGVFDVILRDVNYN